MGEIEENPELMVRGEDVAVPAEPVEAEVARAVEPAEEVALEPVAVDADVASEAVFTAPAGDPDVQEPTPMTADEAEPDEIAAALSEAEARVDAPDSLDDIAPATTQSPAAGIDTVNLAIRPASVPWWPFLAYLGAWVLLTGLAVWQLLQLPANEAAYESQTYALTVLGGLIMTAVGPLLILAVWFAVWAGRPSDERSGLLTSALLKGAIVTLSGAVLWWAALIIVDYLRLGSPL